MTHSQALSAEVVRRRKGCPAPHSSLGAWSWAGRSHFVREAPPHEEDAKYCHVTPTHEGPPHPAGITKAAPLFGAS